MKISDEKEYYSHEFSKLKGQGVKVESALFEDCVFKECDFSEAEFINSRFIDCVFEKTNLSLADFRGANFTDTLFEDCKLIGVDWTKADWDYIPIISPIRFLRCILNDSSFFSLSLVEIVVEDCTAHYTDFRQSVLKRGTFKFTDLKNALFSGTDISGADFTRAFDFKIDINFNKINKAKFSRIEAINLLEGLNIELVD